MSFLGLGGLARRRVDQQGQAPPTAVSPGSSNVVRARLVIVSGAGVSGVFVYSGTPGLGNPPIVSITSASVDPFGNAVTPGLDVTQGVISGTTISASTFDGTDFIINSAGAFFYTGTPAANNLAVSIATAAGTDAFGNDYPAGLATWSSTDNFYVGLSNSTGANGAVLFHNDLLPFAADPQVQGAGTSAAGASLEMLSGQSGAGSAQSGVLCQDSTQAGRANGLVTVTSGGLSGPALLSSTPSFQGPLTLPLPHQTTSNANISGTAGSLSAADRTSLNGLINAVNTLQANLQSAGMEL